MKDFRFIVFSVLAVIVIASCSGEHVENETRRSGDFEYTISKNKILTITKYLGDKTEVEIPSKIDGYPVSSIGESAFQDMNLTDVMIPNGIISVDGFAFSHNQLIKVYIPASVISIEAGAFSGNPLLTDITVDSENRYNIDIDGVLFTKSMKTLIAYPEGKKAEQYTIPYGVIIIGDRAFENTRLMDITVPEGITTIDKFAFSGAERLERLVIPNSCLFIWRYALSNSLKDIIIGSDTSIASYGYYPFSTTGMEFRSKYYGNNQRGGEYTYVDGAWNYKNGNTMTSLDNTHSSQSKAAVVELGKGITLSSDQTEITIPDNATIGRDAFTEAKITRITIGKDVGLGGWFHEWHGFGGDGDLWLWHNSFANGFDDIYINLGKKAGTYRYADGKWSIDFKEIQSGGVNKHIMVEAINNAEKVEHAIYSIDARKYDEALSSLNDVLEMNPSHPGALYWRGQAYSAKRNYKDAIADFDAVLKITPDIYRALFYRGISYYRERNYSHALADFEEYQKLSGHEDKFYYDSFNWSASAYVRINDFNNAINSINEYIRYNPNNYKSFADRGHMYSDIGNYEQAIEDETEAIRLAPYYFGGYMNRSDYYIHAGQYALALIDAKASLRVGPDTFYSFAGCCINLVAAFIMAYLPASVIAFIVFISVMLFLVFRSKLFPKGGNYG